MVCPSVSAGRRSAGRCRLNPTPALCRGRLLAGTKRGIRPRLRRWIGVGLRTRLLPFLPAICLPTPVPQERVSADYHRSDLTEWFGCYTCRGSDGHPILEHLRNPSPACEVRREASVDLLEAAYRGCKDAAVWLLDCGLEPNCEAPYGGVPVVEAALWGNADFVKVLLERGASPNLASSSGWTALMAAAFRPGSAATIDLLLQHGASVNAHSQDGTTALMLATQH